MIFDPDFALFAYQQPTTIAAIPGITGFVSINHSIGMGSTEYPVETGSTLTDNAVAKRKRLSLRGWVADLTYLEGSNLPDHSTAADVWQRILQLFEQRNLIEVVTRLGVYTDMLITSAATKDDVNTRRGLRFNLEATQILTSQSTITSLSAGIVNPNGPAAQRTAIVDGGQRSAPQYTGR